MKMERQRGEEVASDMVLNFQENEGLNGGLRLRGARRANLNQSMEYRVWSIGRPRCRWGSAGMVNGCEADAAEPRANS